jgi:hypothetical protein
MSAGWNRWITTRLAVRLVTAWAKLYTLGLNERQRQERLEIIDSDLWEHTHDPDAGSRPGPALLLRCLRGVHDDIGWRLSRQPPQPLPETEGGSSMPSQRASLVMRSIVAGAALALAMALAAHPLAGSLALAGALLAILGLGTWALEARHDAENLGSASAAPLEVAVGLAAFAAGAVFQGGRPPPRGADGCLCLEAMGGCGIRPGCGRRRPAGPGEPRKHRRPRRRR